MADPKFNDTSYADIYTLGQVFAQSGLFADARQAAQAVVKILAGKELGFPPVVSMGGIYIVKGKISFSANLIAAAIKRSQKYNYKVVKFDSTLCQIEFFENGQSIGISSFSLDDARAAGIGGDMYRKYPKNMLFARAVSNGCRWYCPEIFGGPIYTPDEIDETEETKVVAVNGAAALLESKFKPLALETKATLDESLLKRLNQAGTMLGPDLYQSLLSEAIGNSPLKTEELTGEQAEKILSLCREAYLKKAPEIKQAVVVAEVPPSPEAAEAAVLVVNDSNQIQKG